MYMCHSMTAHQPRERFDYFRDTVDSLFCPMHLETSRSVRDAFNATVETAELDSLPFACLSSAPLMVRRRAEDIARISDPPYLVKFQVKGQSLWRQRGREIHAVPGDFYIASTAEPYSLCLNGDYQMAVLVLTQSVMRQFTPDPDQFLGRRMAGQDADCGLLSSFVAQIAMRMSRLPGAMIPKLKATVFDLLGAVLSARSEQGPITREQLLAQIKTHIHANLQDRRLGPTSIGRLFAVSPRYVHALFETEGVTVSRYIRTLRLEGCRAMLESPEGARASLTDIALHWGFYDLSHMTRHFREEYGVPPRQFQLAARTHAVRSGTSALR
jgi:AraC-like DNA-binding protein